MSEVELDGVDPLLEFPVVTDRMFPHGLRCESCHREIEPGRPFQSVEESLWENGDVLAVLRCVYC